MANLQDAFSHQLNILDDANYIPRAISTALDDAASDQLDAAFLNNMPSDTSRLLLSNDNPQPPAALNTSDQNDCSDYSSVLSALTF